MDFFPPSKRKNFFYFVLFTAIASCCCCFPCGDVNVWPKLFQSKNQNWPILAFEPESEPEKSSAKLLKNRSAPVRAFTLLCASPPLSPSLGSFHLYFEPAWIVVHESRSLLQTFHIFLSSPSSFAWASNQASFVDPVKNARKTQVLVVGSVLIKFKHNI